jgi:hypothetical protein
MFSEATVEELRGVLAAYRTAKNGSWPDLHPAMERRVAHWPFAGEAELRAELEAYLNESEAAAGAVRVFWKLGPRFLFAGCNAHFARDAGLPASVLLGLDDFDSRLPWGAQAAKYRSDDVEVVQAGVPKLDILERQTSPSGEVIWVRVGKAPILVGGVPQGILGMYDLLDDKTASKLYFARAGGKPPKG